VADYTVVGGKKKKKKKKKKGAAKQKDLRAIAEEVVEDDTAKLSQEIRNIMVQKKYTLPVDKEIEEDLTRMVDIVPAAYEEDIRQSRELNTQF